MKGDAKVIEYLNKGLRSELTAINQYWLHFRLLDNWGLKDLAKQWRKESIEEMNHADRFTDRILFLDGFPNMQVLDPLRIGQNHAQVRRIIGRARAESHQMLVPAAVRELHDAQPVALRHQAHRLGIDRDGGARREQVLGKIFFVEIDGHRVRLAPFAATLNSPNCR